MVSDEEVKKPSDALTGTQDKSVLQGGFECSPRLGIRAFFPSTTASGEVFELWGR